MKTFGELTKELRINNDFTLRQFCRKLSLDPSNWSKVERNLIPPPKSNVVVESIAKAFKLDTNSEDYKLLFDLAAISHIPTQLVEDKSIIEKLPVFFRTVRGSSPTEKELDKLIEIIKENGN